MRIYQVDRLLCKQELVTMIIRGHTLRDMVEFVARRGERCSKSSIERYLKGKFIEGRIFEDGSVELKEKEGHQVRVTRYPPELDENAQPDIYLHRTGD